MKKSLLKRLLVIMSLLSLVSCKGIINDHTLEIEDNQIISTSYFSEKFGLPFSGNFPIIIKEVDYGSVDLAPKTDVDDFSIAIRADLSSFNSEVWDGFGPITTLPNGSSFPAWLGAEELINIAIPTFTELFSIRLLVGMDQERLYVGLDLSIDALDQYYPDGLNISQDIKNKESSFPYASIWAYGPSYDQDGNKIKNSGLTILSSFNKPTE